MDKTTSKETLQAGTGFMPTLSESVRKFVNRGYVENLVPRFDHFECRSGGIKMYPPDFHVDELVRFENTSDPDDQSILYAISSPTKAIKGVYIESYGTYHDDLSASMIERLKDHPQ